MKRRLRSGDEVVVIAGNDKGKTGKVLRFKKDRVVVEGVNIRKKHMKKTQENQQPQIIDIECPVHISNVQPCVDGKGVKLTALIKGGKKSFVYGAKNKLYREATKPAKS